MAILFVMLASLLGAFVNLMTKRNLDKIGSIHGYLVVYFLFGLVSSFIIEPSLFKMDISLNMFLLGLITGILIFCLLLVLAKALESGPPGLIFAFQNSSSVLPSLALFFLFGSSFGFMMTPNLVIGLFCVVLGLFWAANPDLFKKKKTEDSTYERKWMVFALAAFFLQGVILSLFFWKTLVIEYEPYSHPLIFMRSIFTEEIWFLPGLFLSAAIMSSIIFIRSERRSFRTPEIFYGIAGGLMNGGATYLLLLCAKISSPVEKGILFPLNAIGVIIFCSMWGSKLYQEKVNWLAIALCILGVILGTI